MTTIASTTAHSRSLPHAPTPKHPVTPAADHELHHQLLIGFARAVGYQVVPHTKPAGASQTLAVAFRQRADPTYMPLTGWTVKGTIEVCAKTRNATSKG
jgi:hypothetical protein